MRKSIKKFIFWSSISLALVSVGTKCEAANHSSFLNKYEKTLLLKSKAGSHIAFQPHTSPISLTLRGEENQIFSNRLNSLAKLENGQFEIINTNQLTNISGGISAGSAFLLGVGDAQLTQSGKSHFEFKYSKNSYYVAGYTTGLWMAAGYPH
jgi:bacteriocin-like protein